MNETTITDVRIPFGRMVAIILKWMLASIPAILLLYAVMAVISILMLVLFGGAIAAFGLPEALESLENLNVPSPDEGFDLPAAEDSSGS
tara:strand:- start:2703 stop:2969 length:267 start_codon:yes stop_codon:yes gene_type:complete